MKRSRLCSRVSSANRQYSVFDSYFIHDAFLSQLDAHTQKQFDSTFRDQYQTFFEMEDAAESIAKRIIDGSIQSELVVTVDYKNNAFHFDTKYR